ALKYVHDVKRFEQDKAGPFIEKGVVKGEVLHYKEGKTRWEVGGKAGEEEGGSWEGGGSSKDAFYALANYTTKELRPGYELHGIENVPDNGSALFIYYHGCLPLDVYYLIAKLVLHKNRSLHCVGDKFIFKIPGWSAICKVFSITAGTVEECTNQLREGNLLCIAPGGVREALFSDPNVYDMLWGKRLGFARVVINARTPVIPMFTENCRESFRTPVWGRSFFRWVYEKTKMPLCPVYGGF
ncbi:unnamed protein product, partial [Strongylus vulgaris]